MTHQLPTQDASANNAETTTEFSTLPTHFSAEQVWQAVTNDAIFLTVDCHGIRALAIKSSFRYSNLIIKKDGGRIVDVYVDHLDDRENPHPAPTANMSMEEFQGFLDIYNGMWWVIPDKGITIDYQLFEQDGQGRLYPLIRELHEQEPNSLAHEFGVSNEIFLLRTLRLSSRPWSTNT